jgi:hypothetical protein
VCSSDPTNTLAMKIFIYVLLAIALGLIAFNITLLDFNNLLQGNSLVALIGIVASLCAICILVIFKMSRNIDEKTRNNY